MSKEEPKQPPKNEPLTTGHSNERQETQMSHNVQEFSDATFESTVLDGNAPVLVDFWAAWCAPCRAIAPVVESLADDLAGNVTVGKLNVDDNPETPAKLGIRGIPTLILFDRGREIGRLVGGVSREKLSSFVETTLAASRN
jgi:thioredoxin 1